MKLYLGIDGGGTKTEAVLLDAKERELACITGGSTNPHAVGYDTAIAELKAILDRSIAQAQAQSSSVPPRFRIALGMAGVSTDEERSLITETVTAYLSEKRIEGEAFVTNDAEIALTATLGREHGVLAIAGTGSIVFGCTPEGERYRTGGWGHLLGDEGSGYRIGLDTLQAVMRSYDGVYPPTAMTRLITEAHGYHTITELKGYIYQPGIKKQDIAHFARYAIEASASGDEVACQVVERNALELAGHAITLINKHASFHCADVVLSGSIFKHSALFNESFRQQVSAAFPQLRMHDALHTPAYGAALLAARRTP